MDVGVPRLPFLKFPTFLQDHTLRVELTETDLSLSELTLRHLSPMRRTSREPFRKATNLTPPLESGGLSAVNDADLRLPREPGLEAMALQESIRLHESAAVSERIGLSGAVVYSQVMNDRVAR
jgi:hypothetical protein